VGDEERNQGEEEGGRVRGRGKKKKQGR
jgi:hypothetical protein